MIYLDTGGFAGLIVETDDSKTDVILVAAGLQYMTLTREEARLIGQALLEAANDTERG